MLNWKNRREEDLSRENASCKNSSIKKSRQRLYVTLYNISGKKKRERKKDENSAIFHVLCSKTSSL